MNTTSIINKERKKIFLVSHTYAFLPVIAFMATLVSARKGHVMLTYISLVMIVVFLLGSIFISDIVTKKLKAALKVHVANLPYQEYALDRFEIRDNNKCIAEFNNDKHVLNLSKINIKRTDKKGDLTIRYKYADEVLLYNNETDYIFDVNIF